MLSVRSQSKTFLALKVTVLGQNVWIFLSFYDIKTPFFGKKLEAYGLCQVIYMLKKFTFCFMKLLMAVESNFENGASTSPIWKT
jgi:hypothetical protein